MYKINLMLQTGSSLIKWQKLLPPIIDLGRMCIALRISLFWIWNDDNILRNS